MPQDNNKDNRKNNSKFPFKNERECDSSEIIIILPILRGRGLFASVLALKYP